MPSFSLVRRFGKQCKTIVDSPVSSGLVEQHVSPTITESSHSQIRQPSEAGNVFSGTRAANSHGLTSGLVALSQHMEGVSITDPNGNPGNINAPVMSNNHVNINNSINNYYGSQANFEDSDASILLFAMLRVGDIYLEEEIERYLDENNFWRTRYKGQIMASSTSNMSIWTYRGEKAAEVNSLSHFILPANYPRHLKKFTKDMHHCLALVFHGTPYIMDSCSINKMSRSSQHIACWWPTTCIVFIREDLLDYYKFLFDMMFFSFYHHTSPLPSPLDKAVPFQLSHPEINPPVYFLPGWNDLVFGVNKIHTVVDKTGMTLTILPNMTIRFIPTFSIYEHMKLFEQTDMMLFATWACQANYLIRDLPINIMDLQTGKQSIPDWKNDTESPELNNLLETKHLHLFYPQNSAGNIYWSRDEEGQHVIEDSSIQEAFGITIDWNWETPVCHIPPQFYQILQTIHKGCGFDPYSTQVAEYLGLPLAVINDGYSGLEELYDNPSYVHINENSPSISGTLGKKWKVNHPNKQTKEFTQNSDISVTQELHHVMKKDMDK
ncbi:hypothetical protein C8J56DRAFT_890606 [Mycena floridula]|nr:hypothetical protein C8J56DRAFT_890606 [Mycena floridula]